MPPQIDALSKAKRKVQWARLRRVNYPGGGAVIFEVRKGVTERREVETTGTPVYRLGFHGWVPWAGVAPWTSRRRPLSEVPLATPTSPAPSVPGAFEVDVATWSGWPASARSELRVVTEWTKGPGVMATGALDGPTAERVRAVVAQRGLPGLEELPRSGAAEACSPLSTIAGGVR